MTNTTDLSAALREISRDLRFAVQQRTGVPPAVFDRVREIAAEIDREADKIDADEATLCV